MSLSATVSATLSFFEEIKQRFPTWPLLQAYVESEEGGYLRVLPSEGNRCIIRYDKATSRMEMPHVRWFRSVIWDMVRHCPLSVAPPKALPLTQEGEDVCPYAEMTLSEVAEAMERREVSVEEDRDGFMIQVYWTGEEVGIATRSRLDASGTFYSGKTFRMLFEEAYGREAMAEETDVQPEEEIVARFSSFLVQHPEHRVVTPVQIPRVYLVQRGVVFSSGRVILADGFPSLALEVPPSPVTLHAWIQDRCQAESWTYRGIVVKDTSGRRWRVRSEKYKAIRSLRGNESNLYERYARIFTQNLSGTYLEYYPEEMIPFSLCGVFLNDIVQTLHRMYHAIHVRKTATFSQVHWVYRPHLYALHGLYLTTLRPIKKWITVQDIRLYLMGQPPARMAFLLRHHQEEYHSRVTEGV